MKAWVERGDGGRYLGGSSESLLWGFWALHDLPQVHQMAPFSFPLAPRTSCVPRVPWPLCLQLLPVVSTGADLLCKRKRTLLSAATGFVLLVACLIVDVQ